MQMEKTRKKTSAALADPRLINLFFPKTAIRKLSILFLSGVGGYFSPLDCSHTEATRGCLNYGERSHSPLPHTSRNRKLRPDQPPNRVPMPQFATRKVEEVRANGRGPIGV